MVKWWIQKNKIKERTNTLSYELWDSYKQYKLIHLGSPVGEQDGCCSALCIIKINFSRRQTKKKKKPHPQFNCSFKIMTSVSRVLIERDHCWIVFWCQVELDVLTVGKSSYELQTKYIWCVSHGKKINVDDWNVIFLSHCYGHSHI